MITTLNERFSFETDFSEVKVIAPRLKDRCLFEELIEIIKLTGSENAEQMLRDIKEALQSERTRFNVKLKRKEDA